MCRLYVQCIVGTFWYAVVQYLAGGKWTLATGQALANFVSGQWICLTLLWAVLLENHMQTLGAVKGIVFHSFAALYISN